MDGRPGAEVGPDHVGDHDAGGKARMGIDSGAAFHSFPCARLSPSRTMLPVWALAKTPPRESRYRCPETAHDREQGAQAEGLDI